MRKFPIGIQTFSEIRDKGFIYVDKTAHIYRLTHSTKYFFLSRPRRFGKSLLISTLAAYFQGRRELFDGLALADLEQEWKSYPVLHLDLSGVDYHTKGSLQNLLQVNLSKWEAQYGANQIELEFGTRFMGIIERAYEQSGQQVVLLVDEYEKPILDTIDDEEIQEKHRQTLNGFYSGIKKSDK